MPSNTAVCPCRPSMPGATIMLTSSTKPASRKPPQICPPPTTASRLTPNCSPSMSIARDKSIQSRPVAIHEMPCSRKCSKYSSVTFSLVIQSNGCPSASPEAQRSLPRVSVIMVYSSERQNKDRVSPMRYNIHPYWVAPPSGNQYDHRPKSSCERKCKVSYFFFFTLLRWGKIKMAHRWMACHYFDIRINFT